jgi:hypothetical protein
MLKPHMQKFPDKLGAIVDSQDVPRIRIIQLADFRRKHPGQPIHFLVCSDGLKNNSGQSLQQQAPQIVRDGVAATVERVKSQKDDLTIVDIDLGAAAT